MICGHCWRKDLAIVKIDSALFDLSHGLIIIKIRVNQIPGEPYLSIQAPWMDRERLRCVERQDHFVQCWPFCTQQTVGEESGHSPVSCISD